MSENAATIDLIGNAEQLLRTLTMSEQEVAAFAKSSEKAFATSARATDVATKANTALSTSFIKDAASWALFASQFTKAGMIFTGVTTGIELLGDALENTGKSLEVIDKGLVGSQKLLQQSGGDVDILNAKLAELGVSAEEAGIKVSNNLSRIQESFGKAFGEAFSKSIEEGTSAAASDLDRFLHKVNYYYEENMKGITKLATDIGDGTANFFKLAKRHLAASFQETSALGDEFAAKEEALEKYREKIAKDSKVAAIKAQMYAKDYELFKQYYGQKQEIEREATTQSEISQLKDVKAVELRIEAQNKLLLGLRETGELATENGEAQMKINDMLLAQKALLIAQTQDEQKAYEAIAESLGEIDKAVREQNELAAIAAQNHKTILDILVDEQDALGELINQQGANSKAAQDQANKIRAIQRLAHAAQMRETEEENRAKENAANLELDRIKARVKANQEVVHTRESIEDDAALRKLELQGVGQQKLHDQRLKNIDAEEARQKEALDIKDPIEIGRIEADAEKRRLAENARFAQQKAEETAEIKKAKAAQVEQATFADMERRGASEDKLSAQRIKMLKLEAAEAEAASNSELEKLNIRFKLTQDIADEEHRISELKKKGVDTSVGVNLDKAKTKKEILAERKKSVKASREARKEAARNRRVGPKEALNASIKKKQDDAAAQKLRRDKRIAVEAAKKAGQRQNANNALGATGQAIASFEKDKKDDMTAKAIERNARINDKTERNTNGALAYLKNISENISNIGKLA